MVNTVPYWLKGGLFGVLFYALPCAILGLLLPLGIPFVPYLSPLFRFPYVLFVLLFWSAPIHITIAVELAFITCFSLLAGTVFFMAYERRHRMSPWLRRGVLALFYPIFTFGYVEMVWLRIFWQPVDESFLFWSLLIRFLSISFVIFVCGFLANSMRSTEQA